MDVTDEFSRWKERENGGESYHIDAHLLALYWATGELIRVKGANYEVTLEEIGTKLSKIKQELEGETSNSESDPFYFRKADRKLISRSKKPWSKELEDVFDRTTLDPNLYTDVIEAATDLSRRESIHRTNLGIFTYGDPAFQIAKVLKLMEKNPDLPISQVWLTKVPKGEFIEQLVQTQAEKHTEQEYIPTGFEEDKGEGMPYGFGLPLGAHPHVIVMFDDSPKELNSIREANKFLEENGSGATFVVVRSRRTGTKEEMKKWDVNTPFGEIDFRAGNVTSKEIAKIFQINTYLTLKAKLGENNPNVSRLKDSLNLIGVDVNEIETSARTL